MYRWNSIHKFLIFSTLPFFSHAFLMQIDSKMLREIATCDQQKKAVMHNTTCRQRWLSFPSLNPMRCLMSAWCTAPG